MKNFRFLHFRFNIFNTSSRKDKSKRLSREMPQIGHQNDFKIDHRRADSETSSDMTPLISNNLPSQNPPKPANRMGHAIGYVIRDKNSTNSNFAAEKHEYHSISDNDEDDDFFKPLDLGPSLMDEVFSELSSTPNGKNLENGEIKKKDLKGFVSNTLNIRRGKKKQLATVKPIKASDQKALESAIAMANALASKSMYDIDKKSMNLDHWNDNSSPGRSPITPNSPSKKFSFFFPSSSSGVF